MNELELLKQISTRMGAEAEPAIDVTARVIRRIQQKQTSMIDPRLSLVTIGACALSALALVFTWTAAPTNDSLALLSDAAVMQTGPEALLRVLEP